MAILYVLLAVYVFPCCHLRDCCNQVVPSDENPTSFTTHRSSLLAKLAETTCLIKLEQVDEWSCIIILSCPSKCYLVYGLCLLQLLRQDMVFEAGTVKVTVGRR